MQVGDTVKVRIVLKYDNIVPASGRTAKIRMQGSGNVTDWGSGGFPNVIGEKTLSGSGEIVYESTDTIRADHLKNDYWNWAFRIDYVSSGSVQWKEGKVEIGKSFTPYTPAPEQLGWSTVAPVPTPTQRYLWKFEYIYYSDDSVEVTQPTNISIAGVNGQTSHVHFAFADNATGGGFSLTTPKAYMGWYADFNEAASNDPTKYRWSKWKGDQGAPGKPGADGKTSYFHMAYADSADGRTGFSFKESGQQYQGYYTDFVQANSTDPTKYTWMDRRAGVEVSGRNLWIQSKATGGFGGFTEEALPDNHITGQKVCYRINSGAEMRFIIEPNFSSRLYRKVTLSAWVKYDNVVQGTNGWNTFNVFKHNFIYHNSETEASSGVDFLTLASYTGTSDWQYVHFTVDYSARTRTGYDQLKGSLFFNLEGTKSGSAWVTGVMVQFGNVATGHVWAPEDIQADIDSKADQALTQQQLNALAEKNRNMEAEMAAKASLAEVERWKQAYDEYVAQNDADKTSAEQKLITLTSRVAEWVKYWEDKKVQWSFLDTNMDFGEEGLRLGKKSSPTSILISNDRIGFYSGGSEVASMSNGTLTIDNGIFAKSLQIGHYREEVYEGDKTINVIRWID
ncbi:MAG: hypothetical protein SOV02_07635 [Streptococcus infantarius]|nr:hypothetical protein [Streptococcus infantarius]